MCAGTNSLLVIWNDTIHYRHNPLHIYLDEIGRHSDFLYFGRPYSGALICYVDGNEETYWEYPSQDRVSEKENADIFQYISRSTDKYSSNGSILSRSGSRSDQSGLWTCRAIDSLRSIPVGIYERGKSMYVHHNLSCIAGFCPCCMCYYLPFMGV